MNTQTSKHIQTPDKFHNSEQMWFWFLYSKQIHAGFPNRKASSGKRPCEVLDVETLVTKLYLSGQLTADHLSVMKEFGDKRRAPHQHVWAENASAAKWRNAMQILETAAIKKGWIE